MTPDATSEQSHRVLLDVQQRAIVVGPGDAGFDVLDTIVEQLTGTDVANPEAVLTPPHQVHGVREQAIVRTNLVGAEIEEGLTLRELVAVEQNHLACSDVRRADA